MSRDRAAYMREYRARVKTRTTDMRTTEGRMEAAFDLIKADLRIAELEGEVKYLKAELVKRPFAQGIVDERGQDRFNTRPFTPVPKRRG
jgi:hypothetical protein